MSKSRQRLHGIRILHEDPDVIVIEKPAGLLVQALRHGREPSVEAILTDYVRKGQWKSRKQVYLVHRLDRETSGVMMVAKTESVKDYFRSNWNELTEKTYLVRVEGTLPADHGVLESYLYEDEDLFVRSTPDETKGKYARTEWRAVDKKAGRGRPAYDDMPIPSRQGAPALHSDPATPSRQGAPALHSDLATPSRQGAPALHSSPTTLLEAVLKTGRKNQIRVQFADAGHPVVGDAKYGHGTRGQTLCLHAWKLKFVHPHTRKTLSFESPPPAYLTEKGT